jgi:hypothetical protein
VERWLCRNNCFDNKIGPELDRILINDLSRQLASYLDHALYMAAVLVLPGPPGCLQIDPGTQPPPGRKIVQRTGCDVGVNTNESGTCTLSSGFGVPGGSRLNQIDALFLYRLS